MEPNFQSTKLVARIMRVRLHHRKQTEKKIMKPRSQPTHC